MDRKPPVTGGRLRPCGQGRFGLGPGTRTCAFLLIEDDNATAKSIELMLKSENFNIYLTDLGKKGSISASCTITTSSCLT